MHLELVTPEGTKLSTEVSQVTAPGTAGDLGILPGHRPLLTSLNVGVFSYTEDGRTHLLAVNGGYLETANESIIVITETAETPAQVDVPRAKRALERAKKTIAEIGDQPGKEHALAAAQESEKRAKNRLALAKLVKPTIPD